MKNSSVPPLGESPAYLLAAAYSAHRSGDRELQKTARKRLADQYGIRITFGKPKAPSTAENAKSESAESTP